MIRHIVLIRARPGADDAELFGMFARVAAVQPAMPGMRAIVYGRSDSPEQLERGFLHGMVVDFDDWAALAAYQADPRILAIAPAFVAASDGGVDGILVFDMEVPG